MFQRLYSASSTQGYRHLGGDNLGNPTASPELSTYGAHSDGLQPGPRGGALVPSKSYGDLRFMHYRTRGKKTRAMRWLVLKASGERQVLTLDKRQLIQTCRLEIPMRDMRLMDSALGTETLAQLLVRDNALVFSMEHVRLIIMHDKVVVPLDDGGMAPPAPPSTPQVPSSMERAMSGTAGAALAAPELKDRFLAHLEGVVMDWAVQHGDTLPEAAAAANCGLWPSLTSYGSHAPPHQQQQHPQGLHAQPSAGGAAAAAAQQQPEAQQQQGKVPALRNGGGVGSGAAATQGHGHGSSAGAALGAVVGAAGVGQPVGGPGSETASTNAFDPEYQPFEMLVLETALSEICTHLHREVDALQANCQPALEALMKTADTANLEAVRRVKTQHARLVTRLTATREALERLMEDDDDMVRMCLTQQVRCRLAAVAVAAAAAQQQHHHLHHQHNHHHSHQPSFSALAGSVTPMPTPASAAAAPTTTGHQAGDRSPGGSPAASPPHADAQQLAMLMGNSLSASYMRPASLAARAVRHQVGKKPGCLGEAFAEAAAVAAAAAAAAVTPGSGGVAGGGASSGADVVEHDFLDVENLLESYAIIIDTTYQTLLSIGEYIDDTEDLINIQLDFSRNKLIRFDILLTSGTFALAFFNIVTGMLGENLVLPDTITQDLSGFVLVNGGTLLFCMTTFLTLVTVFKWQKVL